MRARTTSCFILWPHEFVDLHVLRSQLKKAHDETTRLAVACRGSLQSGVLDDGGDEESLPSTRLTTTTATAAAASAVVAVTATVATVRLRVSAHSARATTPTWRERATAMASKNERRRRRLSPFYGVRARVQVDGRPKRPQKELPPLARRPQFIAYHRRRCRRRRRRHRRRRRCCGSPSASQLALLHRVARAAACISPLCNATFICERASRRRRPSRRVQTTAKASISPSASLTSPPLSPSLLSNRRARFASRFVRELGAIFGDVTC